MALTKHGFMLYSYLYPTSGYLREWNWYKITDEIDMNSQKQVDVNVMR